MADECASDQRCGAVHTRAQDADLSPQSGRWSGVACVGLLIWSAVQSPVIGSASADETPPPTGPATPKLDVSRLGSAGTTAPAANAKAGAADPAVPPNGTTSFVLRQADPAFDEMKLKVDSANDFVLFTLVGGLFFVAVYAFMQYKGKINGEFSKHMIVMFVIIAAIMLLIMGYTEQQIAPAYGLLGTILGYIFGKADSNSPPKEPS